MPPPYEDCDGDPSKLREADPSADAGNCGAASGAIDGKPYLAAVTTPSRAH